jgi:hypothetical protein
MASQTGESGTLPEPPGDEVSGDMDTDIMPAGEQSIDFLLP